MDRRKLQEAGDILDISRKDAKDIQRKRQWEKWFTPVSGAISSAAALVLGWFVGDETKGGSGSSEGDSYPYTNGLMGLRTSLTTLSLLTFGALSGKTTPEDQVRQRRPLSRNVKYGLFFGFLIALFIVGVKIGQKEDIYGEAMDYGVYSRQGSHE